MKKIALCGWVVVSLLTSSAFAYGYKQGGCESKKKQNCGMKKDSQTHKKSKHLKFLFGAVYALDLSKKQENTIDALVQKHQDNRTQINEAFTQEGFDKDKYIQARLNKKENIIQARADLIESIYNVLNAKQKQELKEELDDFVKFRTQNRRKSCQ